MKFQKFKNIFGGNGKKDEDILEEEPQARVEPVSDNMECFQVDRNKIKELLDSEEGNKDGGKQDDKVKAEEPKPNEVIDDSNECNSIKDVEIVDLFSETAIPKEVKLDIREDEIKKDNPIKKDLVDIGLEVGGDTIKVKKDSDTNVKSDELKKDEIKEVEKVKESPKAVSDKISSKIKPSWNLSQTKEKEVPVTTPNKPNDIDKKEVNKTLNKKSKGDKVMSKQHKFLRENSKTQRSMSEENYTATNPMDESKSTEDKLNAIFTTLDNLQNKVGTDKEVKELKSLFSTVTTRPSTNSDKNSEVMNSFDEAVKCEDLPKETAVPKEKVEDKDSTVYNPNKVHEPVEILTEQPNINSSNDIALVEDWGLPVEVVNPEKLGLPATVHVEKIGYTKVDVAPVKITHLVDRRGKLSSKIEELEDLYGVSVLPLSLCKFKLPVKSLKRHIMFKIGDRVFTSSTTRIVNREYYDNLVREIIYSIEEGSEFRCSLVTSVRIGNEQVKTISLNKFEIDSICSMFEDYGAGVYKVSNGDYLLIINRDL